MVMDVNTFDTMQYLKDTTNLDEEKITTNAMKIAKGVVGLFVSIFTALFGITISQAGNNVITALLSFAVILLSVIFLYFYIQSRRENSQLKKDQLSMAETQVKNVDYLTKHFKTEITRTMNSLEQTLETRYSDTITGLTCQLNDIIKEMCEERDKLHTLIAVMTTDPINGIESMTTEVE